MRMIMILQRVSVGFRPGAQNSAVGSAEIDMFLSR